jgi:DNA-directed RNA polymerase I, II, and III subunit RPABC2
VGNIAFAFVKAVKSDAEVLRTGILVNKTDLIPRKQDNDMSHPEVKPVFRKEVSESIKQPRITQPFFTKYEYTTLVAMRAQQIAEGSRPLVELTGMKQSDPMFVWNVARKEIADRKLPYVIRRQLPNNTSEYWSVQELEIMW